LHDVPCTPLVKVTTDFESHKESSRKQWKMIDSMNKELTSLHGEFDMYVKLQLGEKAYQTVMANRNPGNWDVVLQTLKKNKRFGAILKFLLGVGAVVGGILLGYYGGGI